MNNKNYYFIGGAVAVVSTAFLLTKLFEKKKNTK